MQTKDKAVCIRAIDYSNTSQIVTFFTENHGKIDAIAKGSRRQKSKFDGPVEFFSFGTVVYSYSENANLATLTEFEQEPVFSKISGNLNTMNCSLFAAELLYSLTEKHDPHSELFKSFVNFLNKIQQTKEKTGILSLLIFFQLSLLKNIGLLPDLKKCANCNNAFSEGMRNIYFSNAANGLVCRDCENSFPDKVKISNKAAEALIKINKPGQIEIDTLQEIEKILIDYFSHVMNRMPKMAKHIAKIK